jgi:farnesyl diphosphate synthase
MAGGQAIDLASVGRPLSEEQLRDMHRRKTGALLRGSVIMGASCGEPGEQAHAALEDYGAAIGLAFQVIDDVLDCTQASDKLGKTAGKDLHSNKPTYVTVMGVQEARDYAFRLRDQALGALARSGLAHAAPLSILADRVVERDN